jgi:hypothetical protein
MTPKALITTLTAGKTFSVEIQLTANHLGMFKFYLCDKSNETLDCFHRRPLLRRNGRSFKVVRADEMSYKYRLRLPKKVSCRQCSILWEYTTANSCVPPELVEFRRAKQLATSGSQAAGPPVCGTAGAHQPETFRNCADVSIF